MLTFKCSSDAPKLICPPEPLTLILTTSSSTSATEIAVEYDEVSRAGGKSVKKLSKSGKIVKESKSFKSLKNLQKPSVWKNIYKSTNLPSIRYKELEFRQFFELFLLGPGALLISHLEQLLLR